MNLVIPVVVIIHVDDNTGHNGTDIANNLNNALADHRITDAINDHLPKDNHVWVSHLHAGPCGDPS